MATIPFAILNYSMLLNDHARNYLSNEVKKFFIVLVVTILIISFKVLFGCTLLPGIIDTPRVLKEFMTLILAVFICSYNVGLAYVLLQIQIKPVFDHRIMTLITSSVVFFLFFGYLNHYVARPEIDELLNMLSILFIFTLVYTLYRTKMYLKVLSSIVDPIDVLKPTIWFVIGSYISAMAVIVSFHSMVIAKAMFILAMIKFSTSVATFDRRISWISKHL
jgi:hypothetical protein